jgi:8-oxo-dGTP pyrophosphatase MutT (NUDIX family)
LAELAEGMGSGPTTARSWVERWPAEDLPHGRAGAGVVIVLRQGTREPEVLLIERTVRRSDPASGQVALPGGRADDGDPSLRATALRELAEEVGLGPADLEPPTRFVGVQRANVFGLDVAVFAATLAPKPGPLVPSPSEVAHVFWLPLSALDRPEEVERETSRGTITVPAAVHQGHVLWGFTFRVLREFFGRTTPAGRA